MGYSTGGRVSPCLICAPTPPAGVPLSGGTPVPTSSPFEASCISMYLYPQNHHINNRSLFSSTRLLDLLYPYYESTLVTLDPKASARCKNRFTGNICAPIRTLCVKAGTLMPQSVKSYTFTYPASIPHHTVSTQGIGVFHVWSCFPNTSAHPHTLCHSFYY